MNDESKRRLMTASSFVSNLIFKGIENQFASGLNVKIGSIRPAIHFCETRGDHDVFRFCRMLQSVPTSRLLYRQISAIVRDHGQMGRPIIGAFGLSSSVYSLGCRDRLLGWDKSTRAREKGLASCMQLSLCMAVPPYSYLRAGKLIAALAASSVVSDEFSRKYKPNRLRSVVTTSANGIHSPIFNRLMVQPGGLYKRIGETSGYSALTFQEATLRAAMNLVIARDGWCPDNRTIRMLKHALSICNIPREQIMRLGIRKAVYLAIPHEIKSDASNGARLSWPRESDIICYWKERILSRIISRRDIINRVEAFRSSDLIANSIGTEGQQ